MVKRGPETGGESLNGGVTAIGVLTDEEPPQKCSRMQGFLMLGVGLFVLGAALVGIVLAVASDDGVSSASDADCDIPQNFTQIVPNITTTASIVNTPSQGFFATFVTNFKSGWNNLLGRGGGTTIPDDSTVWDVMYSWQPRTPQPGPPTPPMMDIDMYQWNNRMTMHGTTFRSVANTQRQAKTNKPQRRNLQSEPAAPKEKAPLPDLTNTRDEDCQQALDQAKQKPAYSVSDVKNRGFNAGGVDFNMYMLDNIMTMDEGVTFEMPGETKNEDEITVKSDDMSSSAVMVGSNSIGTQYNNLYMFDNELSMQTTTFTMNVGTASLSEDMLGKGLFTVDTLNINMFMCHNTMEMVNTIFSMNVNADMDPPSMDDLDVQVNAGTNPGLNLASVIFLLASALENEAEGLSVYDWMTQITSGQSTVDINMHMYNNHMSMTDTTFTFCVGEGSCASETVEVAQDKQDSRRKLIDTDSTNEMKLKGESMGMVDTIFTMNVGANYAGLQSTPRSMSVGRMNIKMYMFSNSMDMTNTRFTANISPPTP